MSATATVVTTSSGSIAIAFDYSPYLERIAGSLERLVELSTSTGIRMIAPYDWTEGVNLYNWFIQQGYALNTSTVGTAGFTQFVNSATSISSGMPRFL